jgi:hypothetical protein
MAPKKSGKSMIRISSSINERSRRRLEEIANTEKGSVAQIIRRAVEEFIAKYGTGDQPQLPLR